MKNRRNTVYVFVPTDGRNVLVKGHAREDLAGIRGMWSARDRGLWVHKSRLGDVLAALTIAGRVHEVIDEAAA
ncbi:hypothetical protein EVU97_02000 [Dermacoccus sp. 147Ba]|uniref:hypothetical protein n=1 Tax=Dermacoccus sp. 147Ba TaxID=2510111 RepID=UPI00101E1C8B|nr:hypothetical protein [Dermacoccus sp. 147Ba]RYI24501.1 hypothetical protein EVU97_02000 [Dermacoccus sp. 147Ba]